MTLGSAVIVITCSAAREHAVPPPAPSAPPPIASASSPSAAPPIPTTPIEASSNDAPAPPPPAPTRGPGTELARFFAALRGLEKHTRSEHVRVAWLGDSHGASDLWSGPLRDALQKRFGDGGPGFVHIGYKAYRHDGVRIDIAGKWRPRPKGPSTVLKTGDGVFGLGGVLFIGQEGSPKASLTVTDPALPPALRWDLCTKFGASRDELLVKLTGAQPTTLKPPSGEPVGVLRHLSLESSGASPTLTVQPRGGFPELCGAIIETDPKAQPGVVLDTLGINGARLATPLAWNEASWVAELSRRPPDLVIFEYGTNESGDHTIKPSVYESHLARVLERVRKASPECDCLVLAPTDRIDTQDRTPLVRDALRDAARASNCMFWDTYQAMGGKGSILAWRAETPPRAAADGVHLHARGYRELGEKLSADVLARYTP